METIKKFVISTIKSSDFIGIKPALFINHSRRFNTVFGGILCILMILGILIAFLYFSQDLVYYQYPNETKSTLYSNTPELVSLSSDPSKFYIMALIQNENDETLDQDYFRLSFEEISEADCKNYLNEKANYFIQFPDLPLSTELQLLQSICTSQISDPFNNKFEYENGSLTYNLNSKPDFKIRSKLLAVETCNSTSIDYISSKYSKYDLTRSICIKNTHEATLLGNIYSSIFQKLKISLLPCFKKDCPPDHESFFSNNYNYKLTILYNGYVYDTKSYNDLTYSYPAALSVNNLKDTVKRDIVTIKNIVVKTDIGYVFEDFRDEKIVTMQNIKANTEQFSKLELFTKFNSLNDKSLSPYEAFESNEILEKTQIVVEFILSSQTDYIYRKYIKIQKILAELGGLFKCLVVIAVILNYFHNRAKYYQTLFNELFNIDDLLKYFQYFDPSIRSNYFKIRNSILIKSAKSEDMIKKLDKQNNQSQGNNATGGGSNTQQSRHSSYKIHQGGNQNSKYSKKQSQNRADKDKHRMSSSSQGRAKTNTNPVKINDNIPTNNASSLKYQNKNSQHHQSIEIYAKNNALKKHYNTIQNNSVLQSNTFKQPQMIQDNYNSNNASNSNNQLLGSGTKNPNVFNILNNNLVVKNKSMINNEESTYNNVENIRSSQVNDDNENPITSFINLVESTRNEKKSQRDKRNSHKRYSNEKEIPSENIREQLNSTAKRDSQRILESNIIPEAFNENELNNINQSDKSGKSSKRLESILKKKADAYMVHEDGKSPDNKEIGKLSEEEIKILDLKQNLQSSSQGMRALETFSSNEDDQGKGKLLKEDSGEEKSSDEDSDESGGSLYLRERKRQEEDEAKSFYMDTIKKDDRVREFFYKIRNDNFVLTTWELFRFFCCGKDTDLVRKKNILFGGKELIEERMDVCQLMKKMLEFDRFKNLMLDSNQLLLLDSLSKFMLDPERAKLIDIKDCQYEKFIDNFSTVYKRDDPIDIILSNWVKKKYHFE